jgi:prophage tail gpP-like protein
MGPEFVTIAAGGMIYSAFERVLVRASYKEAARTFALEIAAENGAEATAWIFKAGTQVDILFNGDLACRGYVDRYQPKIAEHNRAIVSVSGRSKAQDLIDSSAEHDTGHFKNKTPVEIMQELDKAGVGVSTNRQLDKIDYQLTPGETVFDVGEHLLRKYGMTTTGQADGSMLVTDGSQGRHAGRLWESEIFRGGNIKIGEADHNWSNRHSKVIVRGQRPYGHGDDALQIEGAAIDNSVGRYRPVIIHQDDDTTTDLAKKRAKHRRDREAGNSLTANITTQGFRDDGGKLWSPGFLIFTESPFLAIAQDMLIETVEWSQARDEGSQSILSLVDPRAYAAQGGKGGSSGEAWNTDAGDDE